MINERHNGRHPSGVAGHSHDHLLLSGGIRRGRGPGGHWSLILQPRDARGLGNRAARQARCKMAPSPFDHDGTGREQVAARGRADPGQSPKERDEGILWQETRNLLDDHLHQVRPPECKYRLCKGIRVGEPSDRTGSASRETGQRRFAVKLVRQINQACTHHRMP